jgi:hypothetical protein
VLRRVFGIMWDALTGECRRQGIKHVARVEQWTGGPRKLWGNEEEVDNLEEPDIEGRIIFNWIFETWDV